MTRDQLKKYDKDSLDEMVCEAKEEEAAEINEQGREAQIDYLVEVGI
jgi:hypothetical protein